MNKYLAEVITEELAYKFIPSATEQLKKSFKTVLEENKIKFEDIKVYATPRRLAVIIEGLPEKQDDVQKTVKGPVANIAYDEAGNLTKAALGFAAKNGVSPEDLFNRDNYVWAKIEQKGKDTREILKSTVPGIFLGLKGTHFMRWANLDIKFQRPIRQIVSLFNDEILEIEIAGIKSSNVSRGHRFSQERVIIKNPDTYLETLENAHVIADQEKRKKKIKETACAKAKEEGAEAVIDEDLLDEITYITEWPVPVICSFEEKYLAIPEKVTVTVMAVHQRYFPLYKDGKLLNKFIAVSNYVGDTFENIKAGNERVVRARLEDAVFFTEEDMKKPLSEYVEDLKGMTFQKGLGSVYDKMSRITELSKDIAKELDTESENIERTALLCKADLVTKLVFEFTELQGYIGCDYALRNGENKAVAQGIKEHYFPLNAESEAAEGIEGQIVGIADKIDTVCAVFASGAKISGSQDPLGVRRATLGILKTIIQKDLKINLSSLITKAVDLIPLRIENKESLISEIKEFFVQRLTGLISDKYSHETAEACISGKDITSDLQDFMTRLEVVKNIINKEGFSAFNESINRIIRITKDEKTINTTDETLFATEEEKNLYNEVKTINENSLNYDELEERLFKLTPYIKEFFDKVLVMDNDEKIKNNRLSLLNLTKSKFSKIADFSKISA